jgi:hypothetical protein
MSQTSPSPDFIEVMSPDVTCRVGTPQWLSLRRVPISAGTELDFRAEAFNVTNTPALGAPNGSAGSPAFGTITTAADPRVIQLAVKVIF